MVKIKCVINQQDLKRVDFHFFKSEYSQGATQILCDFNEESKPLLHIPNNKKMFVATLGICSIFFYEHLNKQQQIQHFAYV